MPKFLLKASYTQQGVKGVIDKGGSSRRDAVAHAVEGMGGSVESFYFALGDDDVFVVAEHRGQGVARLLMDAVMAHPDLARCRNVMLATRDAHGLYARYGFAPLAEPARWMAIRRPYRSDG